MGILTNEAVESMKYLQGSKDYVKGVSKELKRLLQSLALDQGKKRKKIQARERASDRIEQESVVQLQREGRRVNRAMTLANRKIQEAASALMAPPQEPEKKWTISDSEEGEDGEDEPQIQMWESEEAGHRSDDTETEWTIADIKEEEGTEEDSPQSQASGLDDTSETEEPQDTRALCASQLLLQASRALQRHHEQDKGRKTGEWECTNCTYTNKTEHAICKICITGRKEMMAPD